MTFDAITMQRCCEMSNGAGSGSFRAYLARMFSGHGGIVQILCVQKLARF